LNASLFFPGHKGLSEGVLLRNRERLETRPAVGEKTKYRTVIWYRTVGTQKMGQGARRPEPPCLAQAGSKLLVVLFFFFLVHNAMVGLLLILLTSQPNP